MRYKVGSNIAEYAIPIALISLTVGFTLYSFSKSDVFIQFFCNSLNIKYNKSNQSASVTFTKNNSSSSNTYITPGELSGNKSNPVSKCENGNCSIDYGSFVLNGIPENYGDFVKNNGASGGTDKLSDIIMQIANQLEKDGNTTGAQKFRDLANIGHFTALMEKQMEQAVSDCKSAAVVDGYIVVDNKYYSGTFDCSSAQITNKFNNTVIPANVENLLGNISLVTTELNYGSLDHYLNIGYARFMEKHNNTQFEAQNDNYPALAFVKQYDSIIEDPSIPDECKNLAKELYFQYYQNTVQSFAYSKAIWAGGYTSVEAYDPYTGADSGSGNHIVDEASIESSFLHPQFAKNTNILSALKCSLGHNYDTGNSCL